MSETDDEKWPQPEIEPSPEHDDIDDEVEFQYTNQDMDAFKERQQKEGKIREYDEENADVVDVRSMRDMYEDEFNADEIDVENLDLFQR